LRDASARLTPRQTMIIPLRCLHERLLGGD
jgi:hypothetical protein